METTTLIAALIVVAILALDALIATKIDFIGPLSKTVRNYVDVTHHGDGAIVTEARRTDKGNKQSKNPKPHWGPRKYRIETVTVPTTAQEQRSQLMQRGLLTMTGLYGLNFVLLWGLSRLGGPVGGSVHGIFRELGGNVTIAAAGILGAFLVLFIISVFAFRYLTK
jgi:hypothetical protein